MVSYLFFFGISFVACLVLILVVVDNGLVLFQNVKQTRRLVRVLILVVVDNGLVPTRKSARGKWWGGLNPCCSGQWSRTDDCDIINDNLIVLILVVVDNGLVLTLLRQ